MKKTLFVLAVLAAGFGAGYLFKQRTTAAAPAAPKAERKILYYYDPMHPAYKSDKPGIAPDCGMDLIPMYADGSSGEAVAATTLNVPAGKQQLIGVQTGFAARRAGTRIVRAVGRIAVDEARVVRVQSRVEGWIEHVYADFTGRAVKQGEPLLTFYSPELVASQEEYLLALKARDTLHHASMKDIGSSGDALVEASRKRLERHWRLDTATMAELERTHQAVRSVPLLAPADGFVLMRNALPNQHVTPDTEVYTLADLKRVWVLADVAEADVPLVQMGAYATVELSYAPGRKFGAHVTNILPQMDPQTRTLKVRLEAANENFTLRPDSFVNVEFRLARPARLTVPEDALIDTGETCTVFIDKGDGVFEPRRVETGERYDGRVEVVSGLTENERIVTSGVFLLDSESKLRGVAPPAAPQGGHAHD